MEKRMPRRRRGNRTPSRALPSMSPNGRGSPCAPVWLVETFWRQFVAPKGYQIRGVSKFLGFGGIKAAGVRRSRTSFPA